MIFDVIQQQLGFLQKPQQMPLQVHRHDPPHRGRLIPRYPGAGGGARCAR